MSEIRIRAVRKRTECRHELHTSSCQELRLKIEVLYNM